MVRIGAAGAPARGVVMRPLLVAVALTACSKVSPPAPSPGSGTGAAQIEPVVRDAAVVADAVPSDASGTSIDLLRSVPVTVRLSSRVANPKIKPEHLLDHDRQTAWNSATDDLVGAWIDIELPPGVVIDEVRLTNGHTGTGPKHEDYYAMNPRIAKLAVESNGKELGAYPLKLGPEMQSVPVHAGGVIRLRVVDIDLGSKKAWRETCVSELEAWGQPPPGFVAPAQPLVPAIEIATAIADHCAGFAKERADFEAAQAQQFAACKDCGPDAAGGPGCDEEALTIIDRRGPWIGGRAGCKTTDVTYDDPACWLGIQTITESVDFPLDYGGDMRKPGVRVIEARVADVIAGGPPELVVRYQIGDRDQTQRAIVCRAAPDLACSDEINLGGYIDSEIWTAKLRFAGGKAIVEVLEGPAPKDALGPHPIVFK